MVAPSIAAKSVFSRYVENDFPYWLQIWQHQFSQAEEAAYKTSASGHCLFDDISSIKTYTQKSSKKK